MQQLWTFWAIVAAFIVGWILTRKPRKKPPAESLQPAVPNERQPGCFAQEEEKGADWKGIGESRLAIKEAKPSLCDLSYVSRPSAAKLPELLQKE
jgi:hypothetical protein